MDIINQALQAAQSASQNEALMYASDNNKTVALGQILGMQASLQQASLDRELQLAANLELSIEKLDTHLQTSVLEYRQQMTAEENRHVEKIAEAGQKLQDMQMTSSLGPDLPPPVPEEDS
ncbi:MAG TPA: hypothetical protein VLJ37_07260 [bacterium]|nr:hypothetical protein [bacterium]